MIEATLEADPPVTTEQIREDVSIEMDQELNRQVLSKPSLLQILSKRWAFNGALKLKQLHADLRFEALKRQDYDSYQEIFFYLQQAINERVDANLSTLLQALQISRKQFNADLESQFPRGSTDYTMIENVCEWQDLEVPESLTEELTKTIHTNIIELNRELHESESKRLDRKVDPENNLQDRYVIQLAVDIQMKKYCITEAQLKRRIYEIEDTETVNEGTSTYSAGLKSYTNTEEFKS